jgi:lipopolysaccharide export LptBFGC system permease protein LptF
MVKEIALHTAIATLAGVSLFVIVDFVEVSNLAIDRVHTADLLALSWYGIPNMLRRVLLVSAPVGASPRSARWSGARSWSRPSRPAPRRAWC